ncbi:MAG: uridine kinase [Ignavibacteria bacterium]|nr:uridine kinase [Ignavibacteria bacterium]
MFSVVIGIAGGSGSGKTTFARLVIERLGADNVLLVQHDAYYKDISHQPFEVRAASNFDHPDALDTALCAEHIRALKAGRTVEQPLYDFSTHLRTGETRRLEPRPFIVVDGILILAEESLREQMDLRVFVDAPDAVRLERRSRRDVVERGRTPESILEQWRGSVDPMHRAFVEPSRRHADIIVPFESMNEAAADAVAEYCRKIRNPEV